MKRSRHGSAWDGRPDLGDAGLFIAPTPVQCSTLLEETRGACNIVSGLHGTRLANVVLPWCGAQRAPLGLMVESGDPRGVVGLLRRLRDGAEARHWRSHIDFLLAMGQTGVNWYVAAGYPAERVFPFADVVEAPEEPLPCRTETMRLAFVGWLISLKGVDLLLKALIRFTHLRWQCGNHW